MGQASAPAIRETTTSTEVSWVSSISEGFHPKVIKIVDKPFKSLIDTGADKTVLKQTEVP